jgi:uncharacterized protein YhbP (UPF0306 family)
VEGRVTLSADLQRELAPLRALIEETKTMVLTTRMPDGTPRATPVFFAADENLRLIFLSDPESVHSRNLAASPQVSAAMYPEEGDWRKLRGVQMMGRAAELQGGSVDEATRVYARRFPFVAELASAMGASRIYALTPSWVRLIDNRRRFGFQQEWSLA